MQARIADVFHFGSKMRAGRDTRETVRAFGLFLALSVALAIGDRPAQAEPKELQLGVAPVYALSYVDARKPSGGGVALDFSVGITEGFSIVAAGFVGFHPTDATENTAKGTIAAYAAGVGVRYAIDVIRIVPSFEATIGVLGLRGSQRFGTDDASRAVLAPRDEVALGLGFQLHYLIKRYVAAGFVVRYHAVLTAIDKIPVYLYVGPEVTFRFNN